MLRSRLHLSAIPTLISEHDAVILDQQVHHSVQVAVEHVRAVGASVERLRHNDMQALENRLNDLTPRYQRVWYLADGVYSMFGDLAPLEELQHLLHPYKSLHLYLDDAHGMSWTGTHGRGKVLSHLRGGERIRVALSLPKWSAAAGGSPVCPENERPRQART